MRKRMLRLAVFCMFIGLVAGFLSPAVNAQEAPGQNPVLTVKVRNIDRLISDIEKLAPQTPGSKAGQQLGMLRMMLQGTDWIDSERSIVAGMVLNAQKPSWFAMIPFSVANAAFQKNFSAIEGDNYYMLTFPPQQGLYISPALENSLVNASEAPAASNLEFEAAIGKLLDMFEPQMAALSKKIEKSPEAKTGQSDIGPQQIESILNSTMENLRQVDVLRLGLDLSGDIFTLHFDVDAVPNSMLAGVLIDQGGDTRLTGYQFDLPLQYRSRAHNMAGMMELMKSSFGSFYSQLGIDFDDMTEIMKAFTGEVAGGLRIGPDGFAMEMVGVLQPGIDGGDFVENTYMPFFERYNKQVSDLAAKETGKPGLNLYERTADSTVAGIKVVGVKTNLSAVIPPGQQNDNPFANQTFEMRIAGAGDLIFIASNDAKMEELIAKSRSLVETPAQGPAISFDMDLGAFFKDIQSMLPPEKVSTPFPVDLGRVAMQAEMRNGELASQISFNIADMQKLAATFASAASKAQTDTSDTNPDPAVN
jgi:hypothetical protein